MQIKANYITIPLITLATALLGNYLTFQGLDWYATLRRPEIAPPGGTIGLVWTIIYVLATLSALLFWNAPHRATFGLIAVLFLTNAVLNALWSFIFFIQHDFFAAIAEMTVLNLINLALIFLLWNYEKKSAILLVPYLAWVAFATYLTYLILMLNA